MMATVHATASSLIPLLESLEDATAGLVEQTDAYLTIANRLSGEDGKHFLPAVVKHFSRLGKVFQAHIVSPNVELSQAALQALGFCAFHSAIVSGIPAGMVEDILAALNGIVVKSTDKNTCTRALWVIAKQNFPSDVVSRKVPDILKTLEAVRAREDLQSVIMEHEALNVVIRLLEQTPNPMGEGAVQWSKLVIPLVVHSASKVRLRAAAALEMGMPLLLRKQQEVAAVIEPLMSSKLIPELQKLFSTKNESNVLKLWPLFVRLLGKLLHRGGPFINSLLHLEELGFRSSSPIIKKIAFIAWKSLIENFALNPEILCSAKRLKLLMQPLSSIQVRTEMLLLTKLEVWWYLVVRLGPNLAANFEQVGIPLLQIAVSRESPNLPAGTPSRNSSLNASLTTPKAGGSSFSSSSSTPRLGLNSSSVGASPAFPSIQLLGLEMLLHYLLGPEVTAAAAKGKLQLSLEPLTHPLITSPSSFTKYAGVLISAVRDSFIGIGKDAPDAVLNLVWKNLIGFVTAVMETAGNKKDKPGSEVLTLLLQALESIVASEALPPQRTLGLLEATVKGIPHKILGSVAYQVANMDVLNGTKLKGLLAAELFHGQGTPALFLSLLFHHSSVLPSFVTDERFFLCLETLIGCGLSGPSSSLAFSESVLGVMSRNAEAIQNKERLWRMWSIVVNPLTDTITQTNEVNQGDALEHNFAAVHCALMFPISHLLVGHVLPQMTQKSLLATWSRLYKAFARCSALVATAEENVCCEELCSKMAAILDAQILSNPSTLEAVASILLIISESAECTERSPHNQKTKSPHTPLGWNRKKNKPLGNLTTFQTLLLLVLESFLAKDASEMMTECGGAASGGAATALVSILSTLFSNLLLGTAILGALSTLCTPLARLYEHAGRPPNEQPKFFTALGPKLEKLLGEILGCLQTRSSLVHDDELLALLSPLLCVLFPHRSKQMRALVSQFWNATFANSPTLTYPEDLKPVLSHVKQKIPIILPGFQAVDVPEDFSGQYPADSSESSQFEANLSGVKISSAGKRDSMLSRAGALGEKTSNTPSKPIAVKLDFGSPMRPRRELLEEAASLDFVFIPPESKERILTEHQKEVKRTKRVDIPAMYNNLDASLDTTVFTQYTQSQEDTMDKPVADEEPAEMPENNQAEVQGGKMKTAEAEPEVEPVLEEPVADSTDDVAGRGKSSLPLKEKGPGSVDIPPKQNNMGAEDVANETKESNADDCNVSTSSDVVSGTPPKPNSRRQSFITLEKYVEGKSASPISITKFTGPLSRASNTQDASRSQQRNTDSLVFHEVSANRGTEQELGDCCDQESPQLKEELPEIKGTQHHPQVEEERKSHSSDGTEVEDEVIPDTQTEVDSMDIGRQETQDSDEATDSTKDEDPYMYDSCEDNYLYDSQCLQLSASQSEIRRSGRRRSRPLRPGEDREEVEGRYQLLHKSSLGKGSQTDAATADPSPVGQKEGYSPGRPGRCTKIPVVQGEEVKERLRKSKADSLPLSSQMSQNANQSLGRVTRSRASGPPENALSNTKTTPGSQMARRSLGRSTRSGAGGSVEEIGLTESDIVSSPVSQIDDQSPGRLSRRSKVAGPPEEVSRTDAQNTLSVSQNDIQSQGRAKRRSTASGPSVTDALISSSTLASQTDSQSQGRPSRRSKASESLDEMSQSESQKDSSMLVSQSDNQSQSRLSRSKASQPSEQMSQNDLQVSLSTPSSQMDNQVKGRLGRRSKVLRPSEEMSLNETQLSSPTPISQMDDQSKGRPSKKSKAYESLAETSKNETQASVSTPVHQTDDQMKVRPGRKSKAYGFSEEMSQNEVEPNSSNLNSQTDDQSKGRPGRRSKASVTSDEMIQNESSDLPTSVSQTDSQTDDQMKGRPGRKGKAYESFEEMSQNETNLSLSAPISQMDDQEKGRTGRRRKGSALTEEMSQNEMQESVSAPVNQTDHSLGRVSRRGKASEPSEDMSQNDTQKSTSSPVCQVDNQSQGRSSRSKTSAPSEQGSQNELQESLSTPFSPTDDQSKGRPGRKSRVSGPSEEMSQNVSTPVSQIYDQSKSRSRRSKTSQPSEEMSHNKMQESLSAPASQTDDQNKGRPSRSRTSKPSEEMNQNEMQAKASTSPSQMDDQTKGRPSRSKTSKLSEEMSQNEMQASESTSLSQTDVQSKGRPGRKSKTSKSSEEMSQNEMQASESTSLSQTDDQPKGRPGKKSKTSKSSEEMSQNEMQGGESTSLSQTDVQSKGRPGRKSKTSKSSEEMSQNEMQASESTSLSQTDDQPKGRPGKKSKTSKSSEEMSQNEMQGGESTSLSQTDDQSKGRPGRKSKSSEETSQNEMEASVSALVSETDDQSKGRPGRKSKTLKPSEEVNQNEMQASLPASVSETGDLLRGIPGRRSKNSGPSEEMSQNDEQASSSMPISQTVDQSKGRPSRRSKASKPSEEMSQNEIQVGVSTPVSPTDGQSNFRPGRIVQSGSVDEQSQNEMEVSLSTPVSDTDSQSKGRPVRRGKASGSSEELSQSNTQEDLSAPLSQTNSQSKSRPSKRSKASGSSEDLSQNNTQEGTSTPLCETDGQLKGRPSRRSRASLPLEEMSQNDAKANFSTPVSQTDSQSDLRLSCTNVSPRSSEEQSLNEIEASISIPVSNTDGKPVRTGKASGPSEELGQNCTQEDLSAPLSQTNTQSKGRPGRRSKASGPSEEMSQNDTEDSLSTPNSQTGSQLRGRRGRRSIASEHSVGVGQNEAQAILSTPVSQTDGPSKSRSGRRGKASDPSEELNQTALELTSSSLGSLTDSQTRGRPSRRSKICDPSEESSQNEILMSSPTSIDGHSQGKPGSRSRVFEASEEVSQTNKQMSASAGEILSRTHSKASRKGEEINCLEVNQNDTHACLSTHVSQADSQCQDSFSKSELADPSSEMSQAVSQMDEPLCVKDDYLESQKDSSRTESQSLGKQDTRSKSSAELNVSNSLSVTATVRVKEEGSVKSFQDFSQLQTEEYLECSVGNSPLEVSESSEDGRKYGKRGYKRKLRNSEAKPCSPLKTKKVPEISEHIHAKESSPKDEMGDCKNLDPLSIPIDTNTEGVELSEVQEKRHLTEVDAPDGTVGSLVESNMSSMSASEAFSSVLTEMQRNVLKPIDDPSTEIGDLATNTQKVRNKRVHRRPRSKGYDSRNAANESQRSEVSSLQDSNSLDSEEMDIESLGHGKTITEATCALPENSLSQQQDDMGENEVFLEANMASAQSLSECLPTAAAACETEASRKTVKESSSSDDSQVQADIEASEWAEDFEEGQQLDSDMPGVSDVAEGAVDLAEEQGSEEHLDIQGQSMNQEEVFASVQEQNSTKEAAPEEFEEDRFTQIDGNIPLEAADSTAIQVLPEELPAPQQVVAEPLCLESPLKQKHLDSVVEEVLQSPSSGKTKGVWSPSASPSTSILKKGQKRPLEVESPSPLHKSRRVSFADPIHHQELADDIDRRSPVIRPSAGSSPRSKNTSSVFLLQKFITTPTRGLMTLSPRSLRSPGYKSPKKCLISEMSQEPKPIPKDCVFPALVGCSAPVEAVLPQITSNMWPRGFGQLVRARNIKTVGDLSALTPAEVKSLPIRSPKLSSVKKALKHYHDQQRKGRSDELKGFDEMEKMTSEPEETELTQQQEDVKPSEEPIADAELSDVPVLPPAEPRPAELPSAVEALGARLTHDELDLCSPGQLVLMHEQLGGMMRSIVGQLQARLTPSPGESLP